MPVKLTGRCSKNGCSVDEDGKCLEGFDNLEDCPNFEAGVQEDGNGSIGRGPSQEPETSSMVQLPSGEDLNADTAFPITRAAYTSVLVLAGAADSGKTTLLASIYDCLQIGPFANYLFAGSLTLMGFERRCHLSRIASHRRKADTERTKPSPEAHFLHLRVRSCNVGKPARDLLLSDLSGETFRLARDSTEECEKLELMRRADRLILLLDGEKLSQASLRQSAYVDGTSLLRGLLDAQMLGNESIVDVLFTKWDLVEGLEDITDKRDARGFIRYVKSQFKERFEPRLGRLSFFYVAARPESNVLPFAYGVNRIFRRWVEEVPEAKYSDAKLTVQLGSGREFDRFILTYL